MPQVTQHTEVEPGLELSSLPLPLLTPEAGKLGGKEEQLWVSGPRGGKVQEFQQRRGSS